MDDDDGNVRFTCAYEATHVEEAAELEGIVSQLVDAGSDADVEKTFTRYHQILAKYHEQAQLLDPHLLGIVVPLSAQLRQRAACGDQDASLARVLTISRFLWDLVTIRGYKMVVKAFSSEVADLEPALALLLRCDAQAREGAATEGLWQAQCTLLLWLSQLLLIPFNLSTVDSSAGDDINARKEAAYPPLVATLLQQCQGYLARAGSVRDMAGACLGRLLTRPDCAGALADFVAWALRRLQATGPDAVFLIPGVTQALALVFKAGQRTQLLPLARQLWPAASSLLSSEAAAGSVLTRKLALKLVQRIGLAFLPARPPAWRYQRTCLDISATLGGVPGPDLGAQNALQGGGEGEAAAADQRRAEEHSGAQGWDDGIHADSHADAGAGSDCFPEDAEPVEGTIGLLLEGLGDKDTVVRWSAAKGIGRVAARLPKALADEVLDSLLDGFDDPNQDTAWHGGCLALAELARRGLLLPARLPDLAPLLAAALQYDVRRGAHSVGAHVRDAAAYACWAFARAYTAADMAEAAEELAPALIAAACYDREVNCRRAASAAFQESVGQLRHCFPHGIDAVCAADYSALAARTNAYMRVAPAIARMGDEYRPALFEHLLTKKLRHWERATRELAARALAELALVDAAHAAGPILDVLLPLCQDPLLEVRHGAVAALAELVLALHAAGQAISNERLEAVAGIVPALQASRLYRGKGGEFMCGAACRLLECCVLALVPLSAGQRRQAQAAIEDYLRHSSDDVRAAAAAALHAFARAYMTGDDTEGAPGSHPALKYIEGLRASADAAARQGCAAALGVLPRALLWPHAHAALAALAAACMREESSVETRAAAASALAAAAQELYPAQLAVTQPCACAQLHSGHAAGEQRGMSTARTVAGGMAEVHLERRTPEGHAARPESAGAASRDGAAEVLEAQVLRPLLAAMRDYTTNDRGDVGSWVRAAAMAALARLLPLWAAHRRHQTLHHPCLPFNRSLDRPAAQQMRLCSLSAEHQLLPLEQMADDKRGPTGTACEYCEALAANGTHDNSGVAGDVAAALLKQACERIDRLRRAAAQHLQGLLADDTLTAAFPAQQSLVQIMQAAQPDTHATTAGLPHLAALLAEPAYREPILEGLVASIGGLDGILGRAAGSALLKTVHGGACPLAEVASALLCVWSRNSSSSRLALPLLRTTDLLFTEAGAADLLDDPIFAGELLERVRGEARGCRDVATLGQVAGVLCHLALAPDQPVYMRAMQALLTMLVNRYSKVRQASAEQLYVALLGAEEHAHWGTCAVDAAADVLCGTAWGGPLADAKTARAGLYPLLRLEPP